MLARWEMETLLLPLVRYLKLGSWRQTLLNSELRFDQYARRGILKASRMRLRPKRLSRLSDVRLSTASTLHVPQYDHPSTCVAQRLTRVLDSPAWNAAAYANTNLPRRHDGKRNEEPAHQGMGCQPR